MTDKVKVIYPGPAVEKSAGEGPVYCAAFDLELAPGENEIPAAAAEALLATRTVARPQRGGLIAPSAGGRKAPVAEPESAAAAPEKDPPAKRPGRAGKEE